MCWCGHVDHEEDQTPDNRNCPCERESPCRHHGGPDPYAETHPEGPAMDDRLLSIVNRSHAMAMLRAHGQVSYPSEWDEVVTPEEDWEYAYVEDVAYILDLLADHIEVPAPTIPIRTKRGGGARGV